MQHLDEGTIHSWLDGALSTDEAARVEAHVRECAQCATAVAEARGFIAASSRILTALDNAPRGVVPSTVPARRVDRFVWRVAATVLVVAAGTLVVVRNRGADEGQTSALADRATASPQAATSMAGPTPAAVEQTAARTNGAVAGSAVAKAPAVTLSKRAESKSAPAAAPAPAFVQPGITAATAGAMDAAVVAESQLRVVGTPRRIGAKVTLYEVAPGDTVTLTESVPVQFQQIVVGGVAGGAGRVNEKVAAPQENARARVAITAAPVAPAPALLQEQAASAVHTISWTDPGTGRTVSLSGRMPEARLQEVRIRIERERQAAKKTP
jgi:hypothetical protein